MGRKRRQFIADHQKDEDCAFDAFQKQHLERNLDNPKPQRVSQANSPHESPALESLAHPSPASNDRAVIIDIGQADVGTRVDTLLARRLLEAPTRSRVQRAIRDGGVLLNGSPVRKFSVKLRSGDHLEWLRDAVRKAPGFVEAEDIPLHIYY